MSTFGDDLIQSVKEAITIAKGQASSPRVIRVEEPDVAAIRKRLGLTQQRFADRYGIPLGTIRDWEQRRRLPDAPARALLKVIDYAPETVARAMAQA